MGKGGDSGSTGQCPDRPVGAGKSHVESGGCAVAPLTCFPASSSAGSVLILAVWALFFLGALAVAVGTHVASGIRVAVTVRHRTRAYALARAGVDLSAMHVAANTNRWDGLTKDCWNRDPDRFCRNTDLGDGAFSVCFTQRAPDGEESVAYGLIGEERNVNLNKAPEALLASFLEIVGEKDPDSAKETASAIAAWRETVADPVLTRDEETQYYAGLDRPYECHHGDFQAVHELLLVRGIDAELFAKIAPYATLHGSGKVNANVASPGILQAAAESRGLNRANAKLLAREIVQARPQEKILDFYKELSDKAKRHFGSVERILTVRSDAFYGEAHGYLVAPEGRRGVDRELPALDAGERRIAFVTDRDGNIQYWHEQ